MTQSKLWLFGLAITVATTSCIDAWSSDEKSGASAPARQGDSDRSPELNDEEIADVLLEEHIVFEFAVYVLAETPTDLLATAKSVIAAHFPEFHVVQEATAQIDRKYVLPRIVEDVKRNYAPPDLESLRFFGRGISRQDAERLQNCTSALVLDFALPSQSRWDGLKEANLMIGELARKFGGLVWDEETRQVFSPDAWDRERLESWTQEFPDVADHITIHAYRNDEYVRAITLGMTKFGLPDVVVEDVSWSLNRNMGHVMNMFCQTMAEGTVLRLERHVDLDVEAIKNAQVRKFHLDSLLENASKVALLTLDNGTRDEGDPDNRLIQLKFDRYPGPDVHAQQQHLIASLFGGEDSIVPATHDERLLAASRKAKAEIPKLKVAFEAGLTPGEFIQVKAPFKTSNGGQEWMWVEITTWRDGRIKGLLKNDPFDIAGLHAGQIVEVNEADIFDYIRVYPDGTQVGNETGKILEEQQQSLDTDGP
jgi:uncharacterized protein YegJ (DUF2314 family)